MKSRARKATLLTCVICWACTGRARKRVICLKKKHRHSPTPADTAHQQTERLAGSPHPNPLPAGEGVREANAALIPANLSGATRTAAEKIARAAKRLNDLRVTWLNPPEWTLRAPEVIPRGMTISPYPDRIIPKDGHEKDLAERTLTKLYNQRPAWLDAAHKELDTAVAAAYGWADYTPDMPDEEILKRLLALNLERSGAASAFPSDTSAQKTVGCRVLG